MLPRYSHVNPERQYTLQGYGSETECTDFYTGTLSDSRQAIMGPYDDELICVVFDSDGVFREVLTHSLETSTDNLAEPQNDPEQPPTAVALQCMRSWQQTLGWLPGPITVRGFILPDYCVYVTDYPRWAIRFLADPFLIPSFMERFETGERLLEWQEAGSFVFWWSKDYYMDKDGNVLST